MKNLFLLPVGLVLTFVLTACPSGGSSGDTSKPSVSLSSSNTNVTAAGSITLTATASDNVGVTKVEFFDGGNSLGTATASPYTQSVSLSVADNGSKSYTAKASDAAGNSETSAAVSVTVNIPTVDTTAPTIVSVTPANLGTGVLAAANIVVTFSEPMNKLLTQSAYQSGTVRIKPTEVQFSFNTEGTVLTINPNIDLNIASGADPALVVARAFAFQITNTAVDLAGNPLTTSAFSFTTQRRITQNLPGLATLSGSVLTNGAVNACSSGRPCAGDSATVANAQYKGFIGFDTSGLPAGIQTFEVANLNMNQVGVFGNPYGTLGGTLLLDHVNFATLDLANAFNATSLRALGTLSSDATLGFKTLTVIPAIQDDYANRIARGNRTQYRIVFPTAASFNSIFDAALFETPIAVTDPSSLSLEYVLP